MLPIGKLHIAICILPALYPSLGIAQMDTAYTSIFSQPLKLDTFTVKAGFDIDAFIKRVKSDTTFYKAFRSLHLFEYSARYSIIAYDKRKNDIAGQKSRIQQVIENSCRKTVTLEDKVYGSYYNRRGKYNYYTSALFAHLFLSEDTVCNEDDIAAGKLQERGAGKLEKSKHELKQLIFDPGSKVSGVPFMADRVSIFEQSEAKKYTFSVKTDTINNSACYRFSILPKDEYLRKTLYNELTTWFRKTDYSILARNYSLSYSTLLYDFDVDMKVQMTTVAGKLLPASISYDGDWHIISRKRERVKFSIEFDY